MRSGITNTLCVSPRNDNITSEVVSLHKSSIDFRKKNEVLIMRGFMKEYDYYGFIKRYMFVILFDCK